MQNLFLITTADMRFWKTDCPILFLGEWCKHFAQKAVWEKLTYEVLPYHWDDRKKMYQDYLYLNQLYEQKLVQLSACLNKLHGVNHSIRYWRIIIGPWLFYFVQMLFDRYQSIFSAVESKRVANTLIGKYKLEDWIPRDFSIVPRLFVGDAYNQFIYSRIIESLNSIPYETLKITERAEELTPQAAETCQPAFSVGRLLKQCFKAALRGIGNQFSQISLIDTPLSPKELLMLQVSLGKVPQLLPEKIVFPTSEINWPMRKAIQFSPSENKFEQFLNKIIAEQLPALYIEGYEKAKQISLSAFPKKPKVIFTTVAYHLDEAFKFWAAHQIECGAKLAGIQHGGHYGTGLWSSIDDHEIQIYDRFYTWGWQSDVYKNTRPLPSAKLSKIKQCLRPQKNGRLLMALMTLPQYSYVMYSVCVAASGTLDYFNDQYRLARALSKGNQKSLLVRLSPKDRSWSQKERWRDECPNIECYFGNSSFYEQLNKSRLFIGTYNATTYLETMAANFPTILFWNPEHWELRPAARPYFAKLRQAGILHDTPEAAAAKVNEIADDPTSWWQQAEVQTAKDQFCQQFARTSDDWLGEWKSEIADLARSAVN